MNTKFTHWIFIVLLSCCSCNTSKKEPKPTETKKVEISPPPKKEANPIYGIDISEWQGDIINSLTPTQDSLVFVFCKASQGVGFTDPRFKENWTAIKQKGFIRGAYHFYMTKDNPIQQAEHFASLMKDIQATDIAPVIDFEGGGIEQGETPEAVQTSLKTFIQRLESLLSRKPIIYTNIPTANKYLSAEFSEYALWIADYEEKIKPNLPVIWEAKDWTFWQKSPNHEIGSEKVDLDVFNGTITDLRDFIVNYQP